MDIPDTIKKTELHGKNRSYIYFVIDFERNQTKSYETLMFEI